MEHLAARLAAIPGVVAVTLGGSRATGTAVEGSDWDFGLYYRGGLDPADIAALGWPGRVFAPGEWDSGKFSNENSRGPASPCVTNVILLLPGAVSRSASAPSSSSRPATSLAPKWRCCRASACRSASAGSVAA